MTDRDGQDVYKIGKVSEITGIRSETLRQWQKRYNFEPAELRGRIRYYSRRQVEQLKKISQLQDLGKSISSIIYLTNDELDSLLDELTGVTGQISIVLVGHRVIGIFDRHEPSGLSTLDRVASIDRLESQLDEFAKPDVVVLEVASLDTARITELRKYLDCGLVVLYNYATRRDLDEFDQLNIPYANIKETSSAEISDLCQRALANQQHTLGQVDRKFDDDELLHLSQCEPDDGVDPSAVVDIVLGQRAYIEHLQRSTSDAFGIELIATIEVSHAHMESALQRIAEEYELIASDERITDEELRS